MVELKSVRVWQDTYDMLVRLQGFMAMRDGKMYSMAEVIDEVLRKYPNQEAVLPDNIFTVVNDKKADVAGNRAKSG